jgi:hypothetical protein
MQPDRQIVGGHRFEERQKLRRDDRLAQHVREHLKAARAEIVDRPVELAGRGVRIVERQRRHESGKPVGMTPHELGHPVVGGPRQVRGVRSGGEHLDRRRRQRQNLLVVLEAVHHAEADVQIREHRDVAHPLADVFVRRRHLHELREVTGRVDVVEDVDFQHAGVGSRDDITPAAAFL